MVDIFLNFRLLISILRESPHGPPCRVSAGKKRLVMAGAVQSCFPLGQQRAGEDADDTAAGVGPRWRPIGVAMERRLQPVYQVASSLFLIEKRYMCCQ